MRDGLTRAAILLLALTACSPPDIAAGCWEGNQYRSGWAAMADGRCPTVPQMIVNGEMNTAADSFGCQSAVCTVHRAFDMLLIMSPRPMPATPVKPPGPPRLPF